MNIPPKLNTRLFNLGGQGVQFFAELVLENYIRGAIEEYLESNRCVLEDMRGKGIFLRWILNENWNTLEKYRRLFEN